MRFYHKFTLRLRSLFRRDRVESELSDELRFHLDKLVEEKISRGMDREGARRAALREMGGMEQIKEECRDMRRANYIEHFLQDVRYGARQLRRSPAFTAVAVLTLALGIGANTAIFSVVNAVMLRPLPYPQSNRLVWITVHIPIFKAYVVSGADYVDWKEQNKTLDQITAYDDSASFNLTGRGTPARVQAAQVSASFFPALAVQPELGRGFTAEEDQPNGPHAAILTHSFWQQFFGSDPRVLGQTITLDAAPYTVVGVMPASFKFPGNSEAQFLVPLQLNEAQERLRQMMRIVNVIGRVKTGVTTAGAQDDLDAIRKRAMAAPPAGPDARQGGVSAPPTGPGGNLMVMRTQAPAPPGSTAGPVPPATARRSGNFEAPAQALPAGAPVQGAPQQAGSPAPGHFSARAPAPGGPTGPGRGPVRIGLDGPPDAKTMVVSLSEHLAGNLRPAMLTMLGVVGLILLIACANVANLMLARASSRGREVAVRAALGAGRGRLARQLLTESILLSLGGGVAGLLLSAWGVSVMTRLIPPGVGGAILCLERPHVDASVLLFALVVSVLTGIFFGLVPALTATRPDLVEQLKDGSQAALVIGGRGRLRGGLVVAELSLALIVLISAGLLMKSFYRMLSVNLGFATEHVLTMNFNLTDARYRKPEQKLAFFSEVLRRAESLPGVRTAALSDSLPLSPVRARMMISPPWLVPAPGSPPGSNSVQMNRLAVSPSYFYALEIPLLKGRTFTGRDDAQARSVAVVNDALARRLWPGGDAVGKVMPIPGGLADRNMTIVGVVGNIHHNGPGEDVESEIYVPYLQLPQGSMQLGVRTAMDPDSLISAIRGVVAEVDPEQPISHVTTLEQTLAETVAPRRFNTLLLGIFAAIALALATVGIYGVIAYSVTQRTHEVGIRMALGAGRGDVLRLVMGEGVRLAVIGVGLGIAGAFGLTRFLANFLYGIRPTDPVTFISVSLILAAVAMLACYLPARRATKVDPIVALRHE
ncbi:MAG TPA: ADOP family duplicated permease [Terriglobia bacterium]|nr:ADOP family duplicated permease [Terriglobia bacterium]